MSALNRLSRSTRLQNICQIKYSNHDFKFVIKQFSKFGFVGLGAMGSGMAKNLIKQKKDLIVFDVSTKATEDLAKEGAQVAESLEELAVTADCIITMLPADKHVLEVYSGTQGILRHINNIALHHVLDGGFVRVSVHTFKSIQIIGDTSDCII